MKEATNPSFFQPTFKGGVSVMVWGCIGPDGVGNLAFCEGTINAQCYVKVLRENLTESARKIYGNENHPFIFQQDNAPCHTAKVTAKFLNK